MKFWLLPLLAFAFSIQADAITPQALATKNQIFEKCKAKNGNLPQSLVQKFYDMESADDLSNHQCFVLCVGQEYGIVKGDEVDQARALEVTKEIWPFPEEVPFFPAIISHCVTRTPPHPDSCQYYYNQIQCVFRKAKKSKEV